jgi:hypothetical protein
MYSKRIEVHYNEYYINVEKEKIKLELIRQPHFLQTSGSIFLGQVGRSINLLHTSDEIEIFKKGSKDDKSKNRTASKR